MEVDLFAGIAVSDLDRAIDWYERLLGAPATFQAHETEYVWSVAERRAIYVLFRPTHAGHSMVTMLVDNLDSVVASAVDREIHPTTDETYANGTRKVTFRDPDGNEVGFGSVPPAG